MLKTTIHEALTNVLFKKHKELTAIQTDATDGKSNDAKSSAGDKHEVGVAMVQLEQEKLGKQVQIIEEQLTLLSRIDLSKNHVKISVGSLVHCENQWYYFSIGHGLLQVDNQVVFCLNPQAPLGKEMLGKAAGDLVSFQGRKMVIQSIF
jgi:transcription elongation GreA/GreB family factor